VATAQRLLALFRADEERLVGLGRSGPSVRQGYAALRQRPLTSTKQLKVSSDIRFWSSGDTKTGPPDGLLTGALRRPLDRCFIGGCRVVVVGCGIFAA
jgi:hypothetical protein